MLLGINIKFVLSGIKLSPHDYKKFKGEISVQDTSDT